MSTMVHEQNADVHAVHSSDHEKPLNSMHNYAVALALCLFPGLSQCHCQPHLSSRLRLLIKHSEVVQLNYFFPPFCVSSVHCFPGELGQCAKTLNTCSVLAQVSSAALRAL